MKKLFSIALIFGCMLFGTGAMAQDISVVLDGVKVEFDVLPQIMDDYTMVPMRAVFEALDYQVGWDNDTRSISAFDNSSDRFIYMVIDENKMNVGSYMEFLNSTDRQKYMYDCEISIPKPATIVDGRTLVPVRAISEASGFKVLWDGETKTVSVVSDTGAYGVGNAQISDYYKNNYYRAKHILVDDEALANELLSRAKSGEDFDKLVKDYGTDPGMGQNPDGYVFCDGVMVAPFEECTKSLAENEIGICKTDFGYHIILRLPLRDSGLDAVKAEIRHKLIAQEKEGL